MALSKKVFREDLQLKNLFAKISFSKNFFGTSPPSVFVGRFGYPKVNLGILSLGEESQQAFLHDAPKQWYSRGLGIDDVIDYRSQLIYSRFKASVKEPTQNKLLDVMQDLGSASNQVDVEVWLKKAPRMGIGVDSVALPIGNPAPIEKAVLAGNPVLERKASYLIGDTDARAGEAVSELYGAGIEVNRIQKILSLGLLGQKRERRLVPSRWSWTAAHSIIGDKLLEAVRNRQHLSQPLLFEKSFIGNSFKILLIPGSYEYELIESKHSAVYRDYEPFEGRKYYVDETAGAFYAARLGVLEFLERLGRQAKALIVREVDASYYASIGVWVIEETVRHALREKPLALPDLPASLQALQARTHSLAWKTLLAKSTLLQNLLMQKKMPEFL